MSESLFQPTVALYANASRRAGETKQDLPQFQYHVEMKKYWSVIYPIQKTTSLTW